MLFNSYVFLFLLLPVSLFFYHGLRAAKLYGGAACSLLIASLIFYSWWNPQYLLLLGALLLSDVLIAKALIKARNTSPTLSTAFVSAGTVINVAALGYYKYCGFFLHSLDHLAGTEFYFGEVVLPIGISFFTFQKIAFLVDLYQGKIEDFEWSDYVLFITFFPQLIAGPIVHHSELMPQFRKHGAYDSRQITSGLSILAIGLAKKLIVADRFAEVASPLFNAAAEGEILSLASGWIAALAYTLQLYYDFSGYSDMAIGIGLLFGIRLPINFNSPYRALDISDFWRRWHITLSQIVQHIVCKFDFRTI
jgi:alginate O-acetyltransferase complex protein AlgI